jgi:FkbM family methyltransferase
MAARRALSASRLDLLPSALDLRSGVIVDIGANVGDWTAAARLVAPEAKVLAVEPAPALADSLRSRFAADGKVVVVERALSDCVGEATFHLTSHSHNGSLRRPRDMNHAYGSGWDSVGEVRVKTTTLDELLADQVASLVKIDVQGAEATVLRGARDALQRTAAVLLEVTNCSHYEGDTLFPELHRQMADLGFELANLSRPFLDTSGNALWFDACFVHGERNSRTRH